MIRFFQSIRGKIIVMSVGGMLMMALALGSVTIWKISELTESYEIENMNRIVEQNTVQLNEVLKRSEFAALHASNTIHRIVGSADEMRDLETRRLLALYITSSFEDAVGELEPVSSYYLYYPNEDQGGEGSIWYIRDKRTGTYFRSRRRTRAWYEANMPAYQKQIDAIVASGEARWGEPYFSETQQRYVITYTMPIYFDGKVVAIAGIDLNFHDFVQKAEDIRFFDTGRALLVDGTGTRFYPLDSPLGVDSADYGYALASSTDEVAAAMAGDEVVNYMSGGRMFDAAYTRLSNGMCVMGIAPQSELYARMQKVILQFAAMFILVGIPFFVLSTMLGRHINLRIDELSLAASRIAAGNYQVFLDDIHPDGLGRLARAFNIMTERVRYAMGEMRHMARYDALTGILNRMGLDAALSEWQRDHADECAALISLDIDGFKFINDLYGHAAGDETLRALAKDLQKCFPGHIIGRNGGDEFTILLLDVTEEQAEALVSSLHRLKKHFTYDGVRHDYTLSIGYAYYAGHDLAMTRLFHQADMALYAVKLAGKNHFLRYSEEMEDMSRSSLGFNLRDITEQVPNAILVCSVDEKGTILFANTKLLHLMECGTIEEFMEFTGGAAYSAIHPSEREYVRRAILRQIGAAPEKMEYLSYHIQGKNGTAHLVYDIRKIVESRAYGKIAYVCMFEAEDLDRVRRD